MIKAFFISLLLTFSVIFVSFLSLEHNFAASDTKNPPRWWQVQSVDTMKYSRDLSREKMKDLSFDAVIDTQLRTIAAMGATHVGIATPYDDEFIPMLTRWVTSAREHNLHVWFRGNFSGWERWFDYPAISKDQHMKLLTTFIRENPTLFRDGDIFTPCPECENGGPGDPRVTRDIQGHRVFLIQEYDLATEAFRNIGVNVGVGYFSMNYDVARIIMDKPTTKALGGIVTIDHYVKNPDTLAHDIQAIAEASGGNVFLGEFGAPIPDIHGKMSQSEQFRWLTEVFALLVKEKKLIGVNYWVNVGGSTELWNKDGVSREAVAALSKAFLPATVRSTVVDQFNNPIANVDITSMYKNTQSDQSGRFILPYITDDTSIRLHKSDYIDLTVNITNIVPETKIIIERKDVSLLIIILGYIRNLFDTYL